MSDYYKLSFKIQPYCTDAADLLAAFLADTGFETFVEAPGGLAAYIIADSLDENQLKEIIADFPMPGEISWTKELIPHQDWNSEWEKKYFKPLLLCDGKCVVHSSFHKDYPKAELDLTIDPKMAFGTGHHATTSMMASYLFDQDIRGKKVLDMGTGTGLLAIIAKKLGAGQTVGIEIDPDAYENALENIAINNVDVVLLLGDAGKLDGEKDVDIFLANINRNIILRDLDQYVNAIKIQGQLIISGFYDKDIPMLEEALQNQGMTVVEKKIKDDTSWASMRAIKNY